MSRRSPRLQALGFALGCACSHRTDDDNDWPRDCEQRSPVELLDGVFNSWQAEPGGDRVLLVVESTSDADGAPTWRRDALAVPKCGGSSVLLERAPPDQTVRRDFAVVGEQSVSCDTETNRMDVYDPAVPASARVLFASSTGCGAAAVAGGLAAVDGYSGDLTFVDDPLDPQSSSRVILSGAIGGGGDAPTFDQAPLSVGIPRVVGEHLLVSLKAGGLVEVDPLTTTGIPLTDRRLAGLEVMNNPRHVVWIDDADGGAYWLDLESRTSTRVGSSDYYWPVGVMGDWIVDTTPPAADPAPGEDWVVLSATNVESGVTYLRWGQDLWWFVAALSSDAIIVELTPNLMTEPRKTHVYWPASDELVPVDFPGNFHDGLHAYRGGLATLDRTPTDSLGKLRALAPDGRTIETLMDAAPVGVRFMRDDRIAMVRDEVEGKGGELIVLLPDGDIVTIDEGVDAILWPPSELSHQRVRDAGELIYLVKDGERGSIRRTAIP